MSPLPAEFIPWGGSHAAALGALTLAGAAVLLFGQRHPLLAARGLAVLLMAAFLGEIVWRAQSAEYPLWPDGLPLHFCSVMLPVAAAALWWRLRPAMAITFYAVICASAQALITPALDGDYPSLRFFFFFASHGLLLIAALTFPLVLRWRSRPLDPLLCVAAGNVYLLLIHPLNLLLGTNYGFTVSAPAGTLLTLLGPAPQYYLWLELPAVGLFYLLNLTVLGLSERDVAQRLDATTALRLVREAAALKPLCRQETKQITRLRDGSLLCRMPAELTPLRISGCKVLRQRPHGSRATLVLDRPALAPCILPAAQLTAMRTAATAALCVQRLARPGWSTIALIGLGRVGSCLLRCLTALDSERPYTLLLADHGDALSRAATLLPPQVQLHALRPENAADVLITCLPPGVVPELPQLREGCLILPTSYSGLEKLPADTILTDDIPQFRARTELAHRPAVGEAFSYTRRSPSERIICYNLGCAVQDVYIAARLPG